jgi:hypothetical protein
MALCACGATAASEGNMLPVKRAQASTEEGVGPNPTTASRQSDRRAPRTQSQRMSPRAHPVAPNKDACMTIESLAVDSPQSQTKREL